MPEEMVQVSILWKRDDKFVGGHIVFLMDIWYKSGSIWFRHFLIFLSSTQLNLISCLIV